MIHTLCKTYGISKAEAGKHKESDFWEALAFDNLQAEKDEYIAKLPKTS
jgi:hypothetical protein